MHISRFIFVCSHAYTTFRCVCPHTYGYEYKEAHMRVYMNNSSHVYVIGRLVHDISRYKQYKEGVVMK
jgi:hypothetical protein